MSDKYLKTEELSEEQINYLFQKQLTEGSVGTVYFQDFIAVNTRDPIDDEESQEKIRRAALQEIIQIAQENGFYDD